MMKDDLENEYFEWLYRMVCYKKYRKKPCQKRLLICLHDTEFTYLIAMDKNRAKDGVDLRYRFGNEMGYASAAILRYLDYRPCTVLEMMVALSLRCEETIMADSAFGDRTGKWFWNMIANMGLGTVTDENYDKDRINFIIERFLAREYEPNGDGGLFTVNADGKDLRAIEIWYQMCLYLNTIYK